MTTPCTRPAPCPWVYTGSSVIDGVEHISGRRT